MRRDLSGLAGRRFDVVVVGGGINGASAAREAALAGYDVLLAERADFGAGATSRSSRLLHCGLRYLAPGGPMSIFLRRPRRLLQAVKTVRRSMRTRAELVGALGERLRPIQMILPIYADGPYAPWQIDAAFALLKSLGEGGVPLGYRRISVERAMAELPFAARLRDRDRLVSVATYTEYQFDWPERLAVDLALELERLDGVALNHTRVAAFRREGDGWRVALDCQETGQRIEVGARALLNFAGPWIDEVNGQGGGTLPRAVHCTKGAHIVVDLPPDLRGHGMMTLTGDGHPFYCFPWRDAHFFGPTETPQAEDPDEVRASDADVAYLLETVAREQPGLSVSRGDVRYTWAGLRPLTYELGTGGGQRRRTLHDLGPPGGPPLLALTNGSLGAHRATGRDSVAALRRRLVPSRPGRDPQPVAQRAAFGRPAAAEWLRMAREEQVTHLSDLLWARSGFVWDSDHGLPMAEEVAALVGPELGWDQERQKREVAAYARRVAELL